jgi:predicted AlkP superfamily pyrophosphatase or phosphodiesterase
MPPAQQIVLFVIDGLRPDALEQAPTPHIDLLVSRGSHTLQARSVQPSITLPCITSIFCGVPPTRHGIVGNVWTPSQPPIPSLLDVVHQAGLGAAAFYTWEPLRDLATLGALDIAYYRRLGDPESDQDLELAAVAAAYLADQRPAFAFVYLGAADEVAHRHGWMSAPYLQAIARADRAVGLVLQAMRSSGSLADTACLVLADHGGHGHDHAAGVPEDLTVPWIASGAGIRRGHTIRQPVSIVDTAPTVANLLGLPTPPQWSGKAVAEAFAP